MRGHLRSAREEDACSASCNEIYGRPFSRTQLSVYNRYPWHRQVDRIYWHISLPRYSDSKFSIGLSRSDFYPTFSHRGLRNPSAQVKYKSCYDTCDKLNQQKGSYALVVQVPRLRVTRIRANVSRLLNRCILRNKWRQVLNNKRNNNNFYYKLSIVKSFIKIKQRIL